MRVVKRVLIAAAVAAAIAVSHVWLPEEPIGSTQIGVTPDPDWVRLASFGFDSLAADYYWIQAIQIVGRPEGAVGHSQEIGDLLEIVTALDPWVDHPYRFAAVWMIDDEAAVRQANALLRRGIEAHPEDWRNRFYLGFNHFFYLDEREEAARVLEPALELEGRPGYLELLVARLQSESGGLDTAAAFIHQLIQQAPNDRASEAYREALYEIEVERRARVLDTARARFVAIHKRDIESVEDLVLVEPRILRRLLPEPRGGDWIVDQYSGAIVSSIVGHRYGVKVDGTNRELLRQFRERSRSSEGES